MGGDIISVIVLGCSYAYLHKVLGYVFDNPAEDEKLKRYFRRADLIAYAYWLLLIVRSTIHSLDTYGGIVFPGLFCIMTLIFKLAERKTRKDEAEPNLANSDIKKVEIDNGK